MRPSGLLLSIAISFVVGRASLREASNAVFVPQASSYLFPMIFLTLRGVRQRIKKTSTERMSL